MLDKGVSLLSRPLEGAGALCSSLGWNSLCSPGSVVVRDRSSWSLVETQPLLR